MRIVARVALLLLLGLACVSEQAYAVSVLTDVQAIQANQYHVNYSVTGIDFLVNTELQIDFDHALYLTLSNPSVPSGFDPLLLQPNNPPGADGVFSILATINHLGFAGVFGLDVVMNDGSVPGTQSFEINQLDENGVIVETIAIGATGVPEPGTLSLAGMAIGIGILLSAARRRKLGNEQ